MIPVLKVSGLRVAIRTDDGVARVLDDVGLTLERGRILGVVGESGSGKSTLIRAIMGILPKGASVDGGEIWFEGENLLAFSEKELNTGVRSSRIGFIPQDPLLSLNPVFKVGTQLLEVMRWHAPDDDSKGAANGASGTWPASSISCAACRCPIRQRARTLSAPVLGRPAATSADRRRARLRAVADHRRRADHRARRDDTAPILGLLRELVGVQPLLLFVTHDFRCGRRAVRRSLCHLRRPDGRGRHGRQRAAAAVASLYARLAGLPSRSRNVVRRHSGHGAVAFGAAVGLPVRAALRRRAAGLSGSDAGPGAGAFRCRRALRAVHVSEPILSVRDLAVQLGGRRGFLRKTVPPVKAVDGVSLDLRQGEILGVVGESGSGKTTLGRTILGLQRENAGGSCSTARASPDFHRRRRGARATPSVCPPGRWRRARSMVEHRRTMSEGLLIHGMKDAAEREARWHAMLSAVGSIRNRRALSA